MIDSKGRLWLTARIRPNANPAFCKAGSNHPSAKVFPTNNSGRQVEMYDPQTQKITMVDLCFATHHLQFDKKGVLWFSSGGDAGGVVGWLDVNKFDQTHDEQASQGWAPFILDTNGNGKRDAGWVEPNGKLDPAKDKRILIGLYGASPNPADGSVWGSVLGFPGGVARFDPATQLAEYYEVPWKNQKVAANQQGFSPRGMDISQRWRRVDGACERSFCELRSQALRCKPDQGCGDCRSAERVPARLEAVPDAWARVRR